MEGKLLIIFVKNPQISKVKTRLAKDIGPKKALATYLHLLQRTKKATENLKVDKVIYYSDYIEKEGCFSSSKFKKQLQEGSDLGARMYNAFKQGFRDNYKNIVLIGSDLWDLDQLIVEKSFQALENYEFVLGPTYDGGYYLIGMNQLQQEVFLNIKWSSKTVFKDTMRHVKKIPHHILSTLNDIDTFEDLKAQPNLLKLI
jgi:rSAM/selenodomain-associated transferase 1